MGILTCESLDQCETRESYYCPRSFRKPMDRILLWAVQSWSQLSSDRQRGRPTHPSQRSAGCSTITEERETQLESDNIPAELVQAGEEDVITQQDLADRRMANPVDPVLSHHTSQERQTAAAPELTNDQSHQPPKRSHAVDNTEQIEATCVQANRWRTGRFQSRKEHHRADLQP